MDQLSLVALANELEEFIRVTVPESATLSKYGGLLFTLKPDEKEGQFCGVFVEKKCVKISFSQGAQLKDPKKILLGSGKFRRHINYSTIDDIDYKQLEKLLIQAARL